MKFLCPKCRAKYQIADERVAGRSVKMKCRKCGHMIRISKAATEGAVFLSQPPGPDTEDRDEAGEASGKAVPEAPASPSRPKGEPPEKRRAGAPPAPSRPKGEPPEKPRVGAPPAPSRPKAEPREKPRVGAPPDPSRPGPARPAPAAPPPPVRAGRKSAGPPLAGPRQGAVLDRDVLLASGTPPATGPAVVPRPRGADKGQVSEGPAFRRPTLEASLPDRSEAAEHVLDQVGAGESDASPATLEEAGAALPRHERFADDADERTPAATVSAASALVGAFNQAVSQARGGMADVLTSGSTDWFVGINNVPVGPIRMSQLHSKASVGAVTAESLVWREGFEDWQPLKTFPELLAIVEEARSHAPGPSEGFEEEEPATAAPANVAAIVAAVQTAAKPVETAALDVEPVAGLPMRSRTSPAAWVAMFAALFFGLAVGFALFSTSEPPREVVKYVERDRGNANSNDKPAGAEGATVEVGDLDQEESPADKDKRRGRPAGNGTVSHAQSDSTDDGKKTKGGLAGLAGLQGLKGVPRGPDGSSSPGSGSTSGQPLEAAQVQRTVSRYKGSVQRSCWQPALDTREKNAPSTARVVVSIDVSPSGSVRSANSSGDPRGYRGLASCITSRVRSWQFPASSGATTVNVPFVFAAQ